MKEILKTLWRDDPRTPEGKYLVKRRDGTVVEWPHFVLGARDPASPTAIRAYADWVETNTPNSGFVNSLRQLAIDFENYRKEFGEGDPQAGRHRIDDLETVEEMKKGRS